MVARAGWILVLVLASIWIKGVEFLQGSDRMQVQAACAESGRNSGDGSLETYDLCVKNTLSNPAALEEVHSTSFPKKLKGAAVLFVFGCLNHFLAARHNTVRRMIESYPRTEVIMGDVFKNISNSTIINRSNLKNSMSSIESRHPAILDAIGKLAKFVQASGNKAAGEFFEQVTEEIAKPEPRKSILKSGWDNLIATLPVIKDSLEVFHVITNFITGL